MLLLAGGHTEVRGDVVWSHLVLHHREAGQAGLQTGLEDLDRVVGGQ